MAPLGLEVIEKDGAVSTDRAKRLALWCALYKAEMNATYRATPKDVAMLGNIPGLTAELITAYLRADAWWARAKSIGEFAGRTNEVQLLGTDGKPAKRWPNNYDRDFDYKLSTEDRRIYYRHLHDLGWRKEYSGAMGDVWVDRGG